MKVRTPMLALPRRGMKGSDRPAFKHATGAYIAFASMAIALISTSGAVVLGVKKQVATYVVEVDKAGMPGLDLRWPASHISTGNGGAGRLFRGREVRCVWYASVRSIPS